MAETEMTSFRLPGDVVTALRKLAANQGVTLSDVLRQAALAKLGICPTCGQPAPGAETQGTHVITPG